MRYSPTRLAKTRFIINLTRVDAPGPARQTWLEQAPTHDLYALYGFYHKATIDGVVKAPSSGGACQYWFHPATGDECFVQQAGDPDTAAEAMNPVIDALGPAIMVAASCVYVKQGASSDVLVKLTQRPQSSLTVAAVFRSGDRDLSVQGGGVVFTPVDWNTWKALTIASAAGGTDPRNQATFEMRASGGPVCLSQLVQAREIVTQADALGVVVPHYRFPVPERGHSWIPFCLNRDPGGPVEVSLGAPLAPASLRFDSSDWWRWKYALATRGDPRSVNQYTRPNTWAAVNGATVFLVLSSVFADAPGVGGGGEMPGLGRPRIAVSPVSLTLTAVAGARVEASLDFANPGPPGIDLDWDANAGYAVMEDSNQPGGPAYAWTEIAGTGTRVTFPNHDSTVSPIALGAPRLRYYGADPLDLSICSNGWISLSATSFNGSWNNRLPGAPVQNMIALCWDDLDPVVSGAVYHQRLGDGTLVVEYQDVAFRADPAQRLSAQVLIRPDSTVLCQYQRVDLANSCTVGLQDFWRTRGLTYAYNEDRLRPGLAVRFAARPSWLGMNPVRGTVAGGAHQAIAITCDATTLAVGVYTSEIRIPTNDPAAPEVVVPVTFTVQEAGPRRRIRMHIVEGRPWQALSPPEAVVDDPVDGVQDIHLPRALDARLAPAALQPASQG